MPPKSLPPNCNNTSVVCLASQFNHSTFMALWPFFRQNRVKKLFLILNAEVLLVQILKKPGNFRDTN